MMQPEMRPQIQPGRNLARRRRQPAASIPNACMTTLPASSGPMGYSVSGSQFR